MKKSLICLLLLLTVLLTACGQSTVLAPDEAGTQDVKRVLFVTDDITARTTSLVWKVLRECAEKYSYQLTLTEVQGQADKASAALNQASEGLYDVVILDRLTTELATEWVLRNAGYYPDVHYLCIDTMLQTEPVFSNVTCVVWEDEAAYYYFGALAALNSQTGTVAFLADENESRSETDFLAFYAGARRVNAEIRALFYSLDASPDKTDIEETIGNADEAGAEVLCVNIGGITDIVLECIADREEPNYLLFGGQAMAPEEKVGSETFLARFEFLSEELLRELFEDCFDGRMKAGIRCMGWENGFLKHENGDLYPGDMDKEQQHFLAEIRNEARTGMLTDLPDPFWTAAQRQEKIQAAAQGK